MRRLAALAGLAVLLSTAGAARAAGPSAPLFGIVGKRVLYQQLVRFDPATLRPLPGGVPLAAHRAGWSFSPDGTRLVLGRTRAACGPTTLRFVDTAAMRALGDVRIAANGPVEATAWLGAGRVAAVVGPSPCRSVRQTRVVTVDPGGRRVLARTWLRGDVLASARMPGVLVLLLAPPGRVGSARLAVVDRGGAVRERTLEAIPAGTSRSSGRRLAAVPGLAVDPAGNGRAFVVPDGERLAEVDLATLRVDYDVLAERSTAKSGAGRLRTALWLGGGLLALTGTDAVEDPTVTSTPAGLRLVDTRDWTTRTLDPQASRVQLAGGRLFAGPGLVAYGLTGRERYRLFPGEPVGLVAAIGDRGFAAVAGGTASFDLDSGAPRPAVVQPLWELLLGQAAPFSA